MCIEREKDNFKSREVNCLKECALALNTRKFELHFTVIQFKSKTDSVDTSFQLTCLQSLVYYFQ